MEKGQSPVCAESIHILSCPSRKEERKGKRKEGREERGRKRRGKGRERKVKGILI